MICKIIWGVFWPKMPPVLGFYQRLPILQDSTSCPRCGGQMRIIAFIEDYKVVKKILDHLGIYEFGKKRAPPKMEACPDEFDDYIRDDYIDCDHVC